MLLPQEDSHLQQRQWLTQQSLQLDTSISAQNKAARVADQEPYGLGKDDDGKLERCRLSRLLLFEAVKVSHEWNLPTQLTLLVISV